MAPSYGTASGDAQRPNGNADDANEESALLGKPENGGGMGKRLRKHMTQDVSTSWGDIILLGSYIITGLLDSCGTSTWGSFLSMQTGKSQSNDRIIAIRTDLH